MDSSVMDLVTNQMHLFYCCCSWWRRRRRRRLGWNLASKELWVDVLGVGVASFFFVVDAGFRGSMPVATGLTNGIDQQDGSSKRSSAAVKKDRFLIVVVAMSTLAFVTRSTAAHKVCIRLLVSG